jgi:hypothetical protein
MFRMIPRNVRLCFVFLFAAVAFLPVPNYGQPPDSAGVIRGVDASVARRETDLIGYTAREHYAVFRNQDAQPIAEMTVKTTYRQDTGKSYQILSESGSQIFRKELLERTLDNERTLTKPANRAAALIDSANYAMTVKGAANVDGRDCVLLDIVPRRVSPYLFKGSLWVDAADDSIVQLTGTTAKNLSFVAGTTQVARHYALLDGYPMATQATAISSVFMIGQIRIAIDYSDYALQLRGDAQAYRAPGKAAPAR